jgi:hypothetical protein
MKSILSERYQTISTYHNPAGNTSPFFFAPTGRAKADGSPSAFGKHAGNKKLPSAAGSAIFWPFAVSDGWERAACSK